MKVKVLKVFRDRYSREIYQPGTEIDVTGTRLAEIEAVDKGLVKVIAAEGDAKKAVGGR